MNDVKSLSVPLQAALDVAVPARTRDSKLFLELERLRDNAGEAVPEFRIFLQAIKEVPELEIFSMATQNWERIDFLFLVGWLISRAQNVGVSQALSDLEKYLSETELELTDYLLIDGIEVESCESIGTFTLTPWNQIPMSDTKFHFLAHQGTIVRQPTLAISRSYKAPRIHLRPWHPRFTGPMTSIEPQLDLVKCVTACTGAGIRLIGLWTLAPEWAPWKPFDQGFGVQDRLCLDHQASPEAIRNIDKHLSHWQTLDEKTKKHLRVPFERLNSSILHGFRHVDAAIDLGIAFESTFLGARDREQISGLIRIRAAKFLAVEIEARRLVVAQVKDVYRLRSLAVHAGTIDHEAKWRDPMKVQIALDNGRALLREALSKIILGGIPDWEAIELG